MNFERFKSKTICTEEAKNIVGGVPWQGCANWLYGPCAKQEFEFLQYSCGPWENQPLEYNACLDSACDSAISICDPF